MQSQIKFAAILSGIAGFCLIIILAFTHGIGVMLPFCTGLITNIAFSMRGQSKTGVGFAYGLTIGLIFTILTVYVGGIVELHSYNILGIVIGLAFAIFTGGAFCTGVLLGIIIKHLLTIFLNKKQTT